MPDHPQGGEKPQPNAHVPKHLRKRDVSPDQSSWQRHHERSTNAQKRT